MAITAHGSHLDDVQRPHKTSRNIMINVKHATKIPLSDLAHTHVTPDITPSLTASHTLNQQGWII
jgi:hypothetical protein